MRGMTLLRQALFGHLERTCPPRGRVAVTVGRQRSAPDSAGAGDHLADARFYRCAGPFRLGELADKIGARPSDAGGADLRGSHPASLEDATASERRPFTEARYPPL